MLLEQQVRIASIVGLLVVAALILFCIPIGALIAASRLVILGLWPQSAGILSSLLPRPQAPVILKPVDR